MLAKIIIYLFNAYTILIIARVVGSWFPSFAHTQIARFVAFCVDPYLNLFRRLIPPIGGSIDLSPILAFFVLKIVERILLGFLT